MDAPVWTIVLAGGGGTRFGGLKQFAELGGRTLLERVVDTAVDHSDGVVVVLPEGHGWSGAGVRATGGATRAESVKCGLAAVPDDALVIIVCDAAHPLASPALYATVTRAVLAGADAAVPGLPLTDAVKAVLPGDLAGDTTPAGGHVSAQMPMGFRAAALRQAHERAAAAVEDSAMVGADGGRVVIVPGEVTNVHVTTPAELEVARALLAWSGSALNAAP
jgi:2-C-methyl-D-erythritol 4-phosphate cytidylyltransferase